MRMVMFTEDQLRCPLKSWENASYIIFGIENPIPNF